MPSPPPLSIAGFGWWLVAGSGLVAAAALFSSSREKTLFLFAIGFGLVTGLALRLLATSFSVSADRRVPWLAGGIVACGFLLSFVPSYQRTAREWQRIVSEPPADPIAAAVLKSAAQNASGQEVPRYTISQYLQRRLPGWLPPWPIAIFGAEWMLCGAIAVLAVRYGQSRPPHRQDNENHHDGHPIAV